MVKKLAIIREIFKGDHNAAEAARKLTRNQISALSGMLNKITVFRSANRFPVYRLQHYIAVINSALKVLLNIVERIPFQDEICNIYFVILYVVVLTIYLKYNMFLIFYVTVLIYNMFTS